jgi:hypothetical protein
MDVSFVLVLVSVVYFCYILDVLQGKRMAWLAAI